MDVFSFIVEVVGITVSGALSPGPLTVAVISEGAKKGKMTGFYASIGHMLVEFPLVLLIGLGLSFNPTSPMLKGTIALAGGIVLLVLGVLQVNEVRRRNHVTESKPETNRTLGGGGLWIGVFLTGLNPFFLVWWFTIGAKLIVDALSIASFNGIVFMYFAHVWMDYAWLTFIAYVSFKGSRLISGRAFKALLGVLSLALIYFGLSFINESISLLGTV